MTTFAFWRYFPKDILANPDMPGARRFKADVQDTGFEANTQFKVFDDVTDTNALAETDILIYKFTSVNPLRIILRLINGIRGGRKYIVYPFTGTETITGGSFASINATHVSPINNDLSVSEYSTHPVSQVTIEKRIATAFSTTAPKRTGTAYLTDSSIAGTRAVSSYTPSGNASGVGAGNAFLLVFTHLGASVNSEFLFQIEWSEYFSDEYLEQFK